MSEQSEHTTKNTKSQKKSSGRESLLAAVDLNDSESKEKDEEYNDDGNSSSPGFNKPLKNAKGFSVHKSAEMFMKKYRIVVDTDSKIYEYIDNKWEEITENTMIALALNVESIAKCKISNRKEIVKRVIAECSIRKKIEWNKLNDNEIPFLNGILNIETDELRKHSPQNYLNYLIPYNYDKNNTQCPTWMNSLTIWFNDDEDKKKSLQEYFGYILSSHNKWKKALWLYGVSDSGKSKICDVIALIVGGINYYSTLSMRDMDDPRRISQIRNKKVNLVFDEITKCVLAEGGFKKLICGEPIETDGKWEKNGPYRPSLKHVSAMNDLPKLNDESNAIFTRLVLIKFNNAISSDDPRRDDNIMDKFENEIEGIINWSLEGLRRLITNKGKFTQSNEEKEEINNYKISQNPILDFIENSGKIEKDINGKIQCSTFFSLFNQSRNGKTWTDTMIGRKMASLGYKSIKSNTKYYLGLKLVENKENKQFIKNEIKF